MWDKSQLDENLVEKMTENFLFPLSDIMTNYFKLSTVCISVGQHPHTFNVQFGQNLYKVAFFVSQAFHLIDFLKIPKYEIRTVKNEKRWPLKCSLFLRKRLHFCWASHFVRALAHLPQATVV